MKKRLIASSIITLGLVALPALPSLAVSATGLSGIGMLQVADELSQARPDGFAWVKLANGVQVRVAGTVKNILFYSPDIVRVNVNAGRVHTTHPSLTVVAQPVAVKLVTRETSTAVTVASKAVRVVVDKKTGALTFERPDGTLITRENAQQPVELKEVVISGEPTCEVKQNFTLSDDESLYGLGQYNERYMDYRGKQVLLVQSNIGIVVPFLVSTRRYGIMWDIYSKTIFKDGAAGASFWAESAPAGVDYYFMAGTDMDGVIACYRQLTGKAPMFPRSAFGLWMSKERYKTQDRLIEVVKAFRQDGFPLDNIVQDWQYWGGADGTWSGMTWDKKRFPDPVALTTTLHNELHVKLMNSIWPSIGNDTELARELDAKGLRHEPIHWISRKARIYDAYSDEGRTIYFKHIKKGLLDVGVDALWMDGTEVEVSTACHSQQEVEADIKRLGNNAMGDYTRYLNTYSLLTTKGTYEGQRATGNKRALTLTRSSFIGQQRYAALPWSGDTTASWDVLRNQISGGINVAMAGQPYWTQDTGGFFVNYPGGQDNLEYRELFARWNQFGIFNPVYRIHGTSIEREPYLFRKLDPEVYTSLLDAARLRYRLLPYIYSLAWLSTDRGYTMMRGLPMDFPDDPRVRKLDDVFMFGPALLVHPVTRAMGTTGGSAVTVPAEVLQTPDGKPGVAVEYFEGCEFGKSAGQAIDPKIDYTWPGPPLAGWPAGLTKGTQFSARWTGTLTAPEEGVYLIGASGDDGVRLWLDGKLVADDWGIHPMRFSGREVNLRKGQKVTLKLEYFQNEFDRGLRLAWETPSQRILNRGQKQNAVETILPAGADWYDFWTNERFRGGQAVSRACPINIMPLYVRAGTIVPLGPVMQYATERPEAPYEIRIYPGADARFLIYEDDNETYDYEKGRYATFELAWNDAKRTLSVGKRSGSFPGMIEKRTLNIVVARPGQGQGIEETRAPDKTLNYVGEKIEIFSPCDFIAAITQHIPDKSFQLVRYYGWYSNKMRGQRNKQAAEEAKTGAVKAVEVIDVSGHKPRRIPSAKWRELIKKVWEADPLQCPRCSCEMRIVALIDERAVIERILRHMGLWAQGVRVSPSTGPPEPVSGERIIEPWLDDPFPDYDTEPVMAYANG